MTAQHTCAGKIFTGYRYRACPNTGRHEHEGNMYCKIHHPPTVQVKLEKKTAAYIEEANRRAAADKAEAAEKAEMKRRAECFPDLLEALQIIAETDPIDAALDPQRAVRVARAAIARATHKEGA